MSTNFQAKTSRQALQENLHRRRLELGMKQTTLAAAAGTTQPHIARLENGRAAPSWELLDRLAAALATTASDLLTDRS